MYEIKKIDAFSLVVKTLDNGDQQTANKMMQVIVKSIRQNKQSKNATHILRISDDNDARLFKELLINNED